MLMIILMSWVLLVDCDVTNIERFVQNHDNTCHTFMPLFHNMQLGFMAMAYGFIQYFMFNLSDSALVTDLEHITMAITQDEF